VQLVESTHRWFAEPETFYSVEKSHGVPVDIYSLYMLNRFSDGHKNCFGVTQSSGGRSVMVRELEVISTSGCPDRERCIIY
jgi:hypothetical protein